MSGVNPGGLIRQGKGAEVLCNEHRIRKSLDQLKGDFGDLSIPFWAEAGSNMQPRDSVRITDRSPVVRPFEDGGRLEEMRWSWPGPTRKPVYNFRSEGRRFERATRCLVLTDGFYEFTDPEPGEKRKTKWVFTMGDDALFAIAGVVRAGAEGDAFSMLTTEPGPDVAPYHSRQVVVLPPSLWAQWLGGGANEAELLAPSPAGTLKAARA
jgi:putative SOS response-associated peptidase YedK